MNNQQGIFSRIITWLFGANWRTSASGLAAIISGVIHTKPEVIEWIPEPYRTVVWGLSEYIFLGAAASFVLTAKDKKVTGGSTQQTISGAKAADGTQHLVDQTLLATKQSGEPLTPEQEHVVNTL